MLQICPRICLVEYHFNSAVRKHWHFRKIYWFVNVNSCIFDFEVVMIVLRTMPADSKIAGISMIRLALGSSIAFTKVAKLATPCGIHKLQGVMM
jgi:hypothetical protein